MTWVLTTLHADSVRRTDRENAVTDRNAALDLQAETLRETWEHERSAEQERDGRAGARELFSLLQELRDVLSAQVPQHILGRGIPRELRHSITDASLLLPDAEIQELVRLSLNAVGGLPTAVEYGELETDDVQTTQLRLLRAVMGAVGSYAATGEWNRGVARKVELFSESVERAYLEKYGDLPD
ncbi:hypothetical protein BH10ACT5_BH10ACT5_05440 [soil metagenome]